MKKLLAILILPLFVGCGAELLIGPLVSPIIQGAIMWKEGEAHKYYNLDSDSMYRAAKRTALEVGYPIERDDIPDQGNYYLIVGENDRLKISVDRVEPNVTRVSIRVNTMGDKPYAEMFYEKLDSQVNVINFDPNGQPS
tara:strand:+ start:3614 stop:4030 length:417 start_codon:yes stop_codon:yes gene_type:complete